MDLSRGGSCGRVEFDRWEVRVEYTMPVTLRNELTTTSEVLNVRSVGSPSFPFRQESTYPLRHTMRVLVMPNNENHLTHAAHRGLWC